MPIKKLYLPLFLMLFFLIPMQAQGDVDYNLNCYAVSVNYPSCLKSEFMQSGNYLESSSASAITYEAGDVQKAYEKTTSDYFKLIELFIAFLGAVATPLAAIIAFFLLRRRLSLYLLKDLVGRRVSEIEKSQVKVKKAIPEYYEDLQARYTELSRRFATKEDFVFSKDMFYELSDLSFYTSGDIATYSKLSELILELVSDMREQSDAGHGSMGRVSIANLYDFTLLGLSFVEGSALRTISVPTMAKKKQSTYFGKRKGRSFKGDSPDVIEGISQGVFIQKDHLYCAEYFAKVLSINIKGSHYFHKAFFGIFQDNYILAVALKHQGIKVPLKISISDMDRFKKGEEAPEMLDIFGERQLHLIGLNEQVHHDLQNNKTIVLYDLWYTHLRGRYKFLNHKSRDDLQSYFNKIAGFPAYKTSVYPDEMVVKISVRKDLVKVGRLKKFLSFFENDNAIGP